MDAGPAIPIALCYRRQWPGPAPDDRELQISGATSWRFNEYHDCHPHLGFPIHAAAVGRGSQMYPRLPTGSLNPG